MTDLAIIAVWLCALIALLGWIIVLVVRLVLESVPDAPWELESLEAAIRRTTKEIEETIRKHEERSTHDHSG